MSNEQAQRIRWDEQFKTYRFEDEQGNVMLNFTSPQAGAEHHYALWCDAERLREVVDLCAIWFEVDDEERKSMGGDDKMREALAACGPAQKGEKA